MRCFLIAAFILIGTPANAITYNFDYMVGTSGPISWFNDRDTNTTYYGTPPGFDIRVTGYVETNGDLGVIQQTSINNWQFTLTGPEDTMTISSFGLLGGGGSVPSAFGTFLATETSLSVIGTYQFNESVWIVENGITMGQLIGDIQGLGPGYVDQADIFGSTRNCLNNICRWSYFGERAYDKDNDVIGYAITVVPLPASLGFLLTGLGLLAIARRKPAHRQL